MNMFTSLQLQAENFKRLFRKGNGTAETVGVASRKFVPGSY